MNSAFSSLLRKAQSCFFSVLLDKVLLLLLSTIFFFLIRNIGEVEEKLLTVKKVKLKMHFYGRKSHHLHQNRTRSTYKPIAIKQIFKENKNKKIFCVWVLQCSPGSYRECQAATSYQSFYRSQWLLEIPSFLLEVQALLEVLPPAR